MWIKPKVVHKDVARKEYGNNRKNILNILGKEDCTENYFNINYLKNYENNVFTRLDQLKELENIKIDTVILTGYAGGGHEGPAEALAKEYSIRNLNVIIIDPLFMFSKIWAVINCYSWKFIARYFQIAWLGVRKLVSSPIGANFAFGSLRMILTEKLLDFFNSAKPSIILSTYSYPDAIISKFAKYANFTGVIVPDVSPIGFMSEIYGDTSKIHYFLTNEEAYETAKKLYPYTEDVAGVHIMKTTPVFLKKTMDITKNKTKILLIIIGSAMGIGKGIRGLKSVIKNYNGTVIAVCGDNQNWYRYCNVLSKKYPNFIHTGFVTPEILKDLMQKAEIVVGKPGGSLSVELASIRGCTIFYAPILGQEVDNAKHFVLRKCASNAESTDELIKLIHKKTITQSIYDLEEFNNFNSVDFIVDKTIRYL